MTYPLFYLSFNIHFNIPLYQGHVFICTFASTYYNDKHHHAKNIKHNKEVVGRGDEALLQGHAPRGVAIRLRRGHLPRLVLRHRAHQL